MCVESSSGSISRRFTAKVVASESSARSTILGPSPRRASAAFPPAHPVKIGDRTGSVVHRIETPRNLRDFTAETQRGLLRIETGAQPVDEGVIAVRDAVLVRPLLVFIRDPDRRRADAIGMRGLIALDKLRRQLFETWCQP